MLLELKAKEKAEAEANLLVMYNTQRLFSFLYLRFVAQQTTTQGQKLNARRTHLATTQSP